jgi:hypothetical protein
MSSQIVVPSDLVGTQLDQFHQELQSAQDRVREFAELNVSKVGGPEFPSNRL